MRYFKKITGERIYLSPVNPEDVEKYTEWFNDYEVTVNLGSSHEIFSLDREKEILEKMSNEGNTFAIITLDTDEVVGNCGLMDIDQVNQLAEMGIFIGNKKYWNKGLGHESIVLLLDYGFNLLNLNNIMLKVFSFNKRAIKCYKKVGFKMIGRRRDAKILANNKYEEVYMDILADEFRDRYETQFRVD